MEVRRLRQGEESQAIQLADDIFRVSEQKSMGAAFPSIFLPQVIHQSYGGFIDGDLVAFYGLVPSTLRVGDARLSAYSIGSVCTHPDYRGKGYAGMVLNKILEDLKQTEASLLFVSGTRSLYTRVGCCRFGKMHCFSVTNESGDRVGGVDDATSNVTIREAHPNDIHAMARLTARREIAYEQTVQELSMLIEAEAYASCLKQKNKVLVAEREGEIQVFFVVGIPYVESVPNEGTAFEWAGDPQLVKLLAEEAVRRYSVDQIKMRVAWHDEELLEQFEGVGSVDEGQLGTVYIVDSERLIEQLGPFLKAKNVDLANIHISQEKNHVRVDSEGQTLTYSVEEWIDVLFSPDAGSGELGLPTIPLPYTAGLNYI